MRPGDPSLVLEATVGETLPTHTKTLRLCFLGCEENPPYGPTEHTANLFLELLRETLSDQCKVGGDRWDIYIEIFRVQLGQYPTNWDIYDGIILPGSFSAAYDTVDWIETLKQVIQTEIVAKQRSTMGICFGHQIIAHSFESGMARKHSPGSRGGRYSMSTTEAGSKLFSGTDINFFYSHGDMVEKIPPSAIALGHDPLDNLPVQSAAYFKNENEAQQFASGDISVKPFAITFQAHPEYAVSRDLGLEFTLSRILTEMAKRKAISSDAEAIAQKDASDNFDMVHQQSKDVFATSAKVLGWFS